MRIAFGIIGIIMSFLIIIYRVPINDFIGGVAWAERKFGNGGTYTLMVIVSVLLFFFSLTYMAGGFGLFFGQGNGFFDSVR